MIVEEAPENRSAGWTMGDLLRGGAAGFGLFLVSLILLSASGLQSTMSSIAYGAVVVAALYTGLGTGLWYFVIGRGKGTGDEVGFKAVGPRVWLSTPFIAGGVLILNGVVVTVLRSVIGEVPDVQDQVLGPGADGLALGDLFWLLVVGAVVAPVVEESFFRGLLFRRFRRRWAYMPAASLSAALFAVAHVSPRLFPSLFILGFVLAWMTDKHDSILPAIAVHGINNTIALVVLYATLA